MYTVVVPGCKRRVELWPGPLSLSQTPPPGGGGRCRILFGDALVELVGCGQPSERWFIQEGYAPPGGTGRFFTLVLDDPRMTELDLAVSDYPRVNWCSCDPAADTCIHRVVVAAVIKSGHLPDPRTNQEADVGVTDWEAYYADLGDPGA